MHIVQIAPTIGPGFGVAGVAWNLEREFRELGHTVDSFTFGTASAMGRPWRARSPRSRIGSGVFLLRRAAWFSTVGTRRAKRFLAERPGSVSICHNGVMAGDVYVNHGIVGEAMRQRGNGVWRMLRNPTHTFTFVRDLIRYRTGIHQAVVALSASEPDALRRTYGRVRPRIEVIPNGVDGERFQPPTDAERRAARESLQLDDEHRVALFVGYEFERKGLEHAIQALTEATTVLLLAVGGYEHSIENARAQAERLGVADRVLFTGPRQNLLELYAAADMFVFPSAYESHGLVILEALASGIPVVCTRVGIAPEVIVDGENGYLTGQDPREIAQRLEELAAAEPGSWRERCRESALRHGWRAAAASYVALLEDLGARIPASARRGA
ncbi:glycosyltransferase family 4 protein [Microbacterium sp. SD291]|uniref:glycosyltransferase family 4 protein n=1 Tax=Microbacterium sp. SD291 TaxID=2782007 RepID=UPI001A969FE0|nr:glycosyltransferase family 4 protein [Microbacterium sp. SD291]MBO0980983.1 glycosyltransferase family 4 protein [Microbacterium sp. SD291]